MEGLDIPGIEVQVRKTVPLPTVWIGLQECPQSSDMERLVASFIKYCTTSETRFLLHLEHRHTDRMTPPDVPSLMYIVGKLLEHGDELDHKLYGTCVQCKDLDHAARMAKDMFLNAYRPKRAFDLLQGPEAAQRFLEALNVKAQRKIDAKSRKL